MSDRPAKLADRFSIGIVAALTILYLASFPVHHMPIFVVVPVIAAGWFYRARGGLIAGIIAVLIDFFLTNPTLDYLLKHEVQNFFLLGHFYVLLAGYGVGRLRETNDSREEIGLTLRFRERYLTILNLATSDILSPKNPDDRYYYLLTHLANLFVANYGYFFRWDSNREQGVVIASTLSVERQPPDALLNPVKSDIIESILKTDQPVVINDVSHSQDAINSVLFTNPASPIHSMLSIPLVVKNHKLGAIILAFESPRHFMPVEINNAKEAGEQIAMALWNTQQEIELQHSLRKMQSLADISIALSETERIGLKNVLNLIVKSTKDLIANVEQAVIHLLDEKEQILVSAAVIGYTELEGGKRNIRLGEGVAGQVILSGETVNIADITTDPRFIKLGTEPSYRSLLVTPVLSGEQKLGTISIQSNQPYAFTANDLNLLTQLGTQAAIAIENANLLENTKQALKEVNALYRINKGLAASLDPHDLLQDTVELLQKNFGYHYVQVFVADLQTGNFVMRAGSGAIGSELKKLGHYLKPGQGIVGYVAETGEPYFTNNVDESVSFVPNPFLPETKSEMAVPVKMGNEVLGILDVQQSPPKHLSERDMQLVSTVADQFAIVLQKATLYEELQISLQQEKAIRNQLVQNERLTIMGRLLASVSHELNNPLQAIQNALFLLKEEKGISQQGRQDLNIVLAESERMAGMIERLRDTYRPTQTHEFRLTQLNNLIEDVHALIATHLRHNEIIFEFHPEENLPVIPALSDQIRQVVLNLMMNAVEAMPSGGTLKVCTKCQADCREIMISVSDTGAGIQEDILPHIFEAFVTDKPQGTGLGLTITYDIVTKHRGRITAENNPDKGATLRVWLPLESREVI